MTDHAPQFLWFSSGQWQEIQWWQQQLQKGPAVAAKGPVVVRWWQGGAWWQGIWCWQGGERSSEKSSGGEESGSTAIDAYAQLDQKPLDFAAGHVPPAGQM